MDIEELRKRAMDSPQSLTKHEWGEIFKDAFSAPKKDFADAEPQHKPTLKQKKELWQW